MKNDRQMKPIRHRSVFMGLCVGLALLVMTAAEAGAVAITNEYWIHDKTNGLNAGTLADPFQATNQVSFDSIMAQVTATTNVTIHLLPGTYNTSGNNYWEINPWRLKSGSRLLGSGMHATTVKLTNNPPANTHVIEGNFGAARVEVADLTVDANGQSAVTYDWTHGVVLYGRDCTIQRVRLINTKGEAASGKSSFGLRIWPLQSSAQDSPVDVTATGGTIRDCILESFQGDYHQGVGMVGGGSIENCKVYFPPQATNWGFAYTGWYVNNLLVRGNYSENGSSGYYSENSTTNLIVSHNFFKNVSVGVYVAIGVGNEHMDNVSLLFNKIECNAGYSGGGGISFWRASSNRFSNIRVIGNTIRSLYGAVPPAVQAGINLVGVSGGVVRDNVVATNCTYVFTDSVDLNVSDNFDFEGRLLTKINQVQPVGSIQRRAVSANATLGYGDRYVGVNPSSSMTITLPSASSREGKDFIIVDESGTASGSRTITIQAASGETINGSSTVVINSAYGFRRLISAGSKWVLY